MSKLRLYDYNNYFNRIVKKESTLADYGTPLYTLDETNFDLGDNINTKHVINYDGFGGDYVIITNNKDEITSRWFVLNNNKIRGNQHILHLRRDLIVDNYDKIINAPAIINRAIVKDKENPLLYNNEGFSFNQIKQKEFLLKADTCAWYALYINKNYNSIATGTINIAGVPYDEEIQTPIANSIYGTNAYFLADNVKCVVRVRKPIGTGYLFNVSSNTPTGTYFTEWAYGNSITRPTLDLTTLYNESYACLANKFDTIKAKIFLDDNYNETTGVPASTQLKLTSIPPEGIVVKDSANKYYRVKSSVIYANKNGNSSFSTGNLGLYIKSLFDTLTGTNFYNGGIDWSYDSKIIYVSYEEIVTTNLTYSIDFSTQTNTNTDYNVIMIPYNDLVLVDNADTEYKMTSDISAQLVQSIISTITPAYIYDFQLLPYCPVYTTGAEFYERTYQTPGRYLVSERTSIRYEYLDTKDYYVDTETGYGLFIYFCRDISFTFNLAAKDYSKQTLPDMINIPSRTSNEAMNYKLSNECDIFRITSPNYNGIFEFSGAKNNGVDYFNIDVTLRPYNPYIHINPNFKFLYGQDFNDSRGLICQGDFSLPMITDQFKDYEVRNKNYLNIFNREISHMDFEFEKARTEAIFGAVTGTIGGGISGAVAGGKLGGGLGAGIGATTGLIGGAIGGAIDYNIMIERQAESKNLKFDMFNYQLGNIKALPYSLSKITPLTYNNKIWPFVEIYSCTDTESNILLDKIKYTSMNVNAIGYISNYLQSDKTFISASLIRLEDLHAQTQEANAIYNELVKGVYI